QLPYHPEHAVVQAFMFYKNMEPSSDGEGTSFPMCPRTILKRVIDTAFEELGLTFLVGFESEFVLAKPGDTLIPIDDTAYSSSSSFRKGPLDPARVLDEIARNLDDQSIPVDQFHGEACLGQFEIVTAPANPLQAADNVVLTRETIHNVAGKYNLKA